MMKLKIFLPMVLLIGITDSIIAQNCEAKINMIAGSVAIFNPSFEFGFNNHTALSFDYIGAFFEENYMGSGYPMIFSMGLIGYRYYLKDSEHNGLFIGGDFGLNMFKMNKNIIPLVANDRGDNYDIGYGYLLGLTFGYKYPINRRLSVEASLSGGWQHTRHEVYTMNGELFIPFNSSGEWTPYKAGIYLNYKL